MTEQNLCGIWKMRRTGESAYIPGSVPGTVYTDLLAEGKMEDPFWKDNEGKALELMEYDYEYELSFTVESEVEKCRKKVLHFDGIDTIADIILNGQLIGNAYNMHRVWEYDVTEWLKPGENKIQVILHSPNQYIREEFKKCRTLGSEDALDGFVHIRKAHCMFGWDWGAHLPDAGIFRPVTLYGIEEGRIDNVYIEQHHEPGAVELDIHVEKKDWILDNENWNYEVILTTPEGGQRKYEDSPERIKITDPMLWWPNGYGEQYLYKVKVNLYCKGNIADTWEKKIGLRTMTVCRKKDEWGECFAHEVNGIRVFAMGADYIPEDHLIGRTTREKTYRLLKDCRDANFNTIRVWGGGYYPEDWFFEICDELGLMVWQDFMFACAVYELTEEFRDNIRREFIDNIKRIRHHACLALWCGNNEMEQFVSEGHHWVTKQSEVRDYIIMYEDLIPQILKEYDPQTFYWPASPSSGGSFDKPNDPDRGDVHYWEVWHGNKPFSEYRKYFFRYASEFGFQSFPCRRTIETFTDDERDMNPFSYIMEKHQRNYGANGKIMNYLQQTFLYPSDFSAFLYASQLLQGEAIRYGVEHFRRNRGRCMGAVYWQLNDCWPVISWSSIDYTGRWKALHYYAKRFFAPLLISCQEEGMMTQEADMNREHFVFEKSIRLNVSNETRNEEEAEIRWQVRNARAEILSEEKETVQIPALTSIWLEKKQLPEIDIFHEYVSYQLVKGEEIISEGTVLFSYPKYFNYEDPKLSLEVQGDEITVKAESYAKSVEIVNEEENLVLSDNYFDMNGGEKKIKVLRGKTDGLKVRSVYNIR